MDSKQTSRRKQDHIELAFLSQQSDSDNRFDYEPFLSAHPADNSIPETEFCGRRLKLPLWVSSMTGGAEKAGIINKNLAKACAEFGMGMGLGSCRIILNDDVYLSDFTVRKYMGYDLPLYANLGIAQIEELLENGQLDRVTELIKKLEADGLIIHVNPLQEWLQPEGDRINHPPLETIKRFMDKVQTKVIVKEVGQGFGPASFMELLKLPVEAIEFGAHGGTNFALLELFRQDEEVRAQMEPLAGIGHSAKEMVNFANNAMERLGDKALCRNLIISGGIQNYLDGYYLIGRSNINAVYAQASAFLKYATGDYSKLQNYCELQKKGLQTCYQYLRVRTQ